MASAHGCTEERVRENEPSETTILAPKGTERHPDQASDQTSDHRTKTGLGLAAATEELLAAVAGGSAASVELAHALAAAVLDDELVNRALVLRDLLTTMNPHALVRAVELAERVLLGRSATLGSACRR